MYKDCPCEISHEANFCEIFPWNLAVHCLGITALFLKFQAIKETICEMAGGREREKALRTGLLCNFLKTRAFSLQRRLFMSVSIISERQNSS